MSQDDLNIANDTRTNVRTKIRSGVQAVANNQKGPSAPASPQEGWLWLDDNTPSATVWTLSLYDGTDWIVLGTFDTVANTFTAQGAAAAVPAGFMGPYAGSSAPSGWAFCDGSSQLRVGTYATLFAAIGLTYGSADGTHFNLPDMRGRLAVGRDNMGAAAAGRVTATTMTPDGNTLGATGGAQTHTLTAAEQASMPVTVTGGFAYDGVGGNPSLGGGGGGANALTGTATGSGGAHDNMPPGLVVNYIIKL